MAHWQGEMCSPLHNPGDWSPLTVFLENLKVCRETCSCPQSLFHPTFLSSTLIFPSSCHFIFMLPSPPFFSIFSTPCHFKRQKGWERKGGEEWRLAAYSDPSLHFLSLPFEMAQVWGGLAEAAVSTSALPPLQHNKQWFSQCASMNP